MLKPRCTKNFARYPFDVQTCVMKIGSCELTLIIYQSFHVSLVYFFFLSNFAAANYSHSFYHHVKTDSQPRRWFWHGIRMPRFRRAWKKISVNFVLKSFLPTKRWRWEVRETSVFWSSEFDWKDTVAARSYKASCLAWSLWKLPTRYSG